jgi:hypothetical protein
MTTSERKPNQDMTYSPRHVILPHDRLDISTTIYRRKLESSGSMQCFSTYTYSLLSFAIVMLITQFIIHGAPGLYIMESLPNELKLQVFAPLDQKTLSALRKTSKKATNAAEEYLYEEPVIALKDSASFYESRILAFYCSIIRKPKLATFVTHFTVKPEARLVRYRLRDVFPDIPANQTLMVKHRNCILATTECELVSRIL